MKCKNCGAELTDRSIVCPVCGSVNSENYPQTENCNVEEEFDKCAKRLSECIKAEYSLTEYAWNKSVQRYASVMKKTRDILSSGMLVSKRINVEDYLENIDAFLKKSSSAEFQIALIGVVKAGKSTLMNAITGCEVASTAVTPETASLTKFRSSGTDENYVKVSFYTEKEWSDLWNSASKDRATVFHQEYQSLNAEAIKNNWIGHETICNSFSDFNEFTKEIVKWTSAKAPEHYFVNEVEIGLVSLDMPPEVVFVDTPGLDDPVEYRSKITQKYIKEADAVVVCVKADALKGTELRTMADVFAYSRTTPEKVYIAATQCDRLNRPSSDWNALFELWLKHLEKGQYFNSSELARKNIVSTSAGLYNLLNKLSDKKFIDSMDIETEDEVYSILAKYRCRRLEDLEDSQKLNALYDNTGIEHIKVQLQNEIIAKRKELMAKEIHGSYIACSEKIKKAVLSEISANDDTIATLKNSREELLKKSEEKKAELDDFRIQKDKIKQELDTLISDTHDQIQKLIDSVSRMADDFNE